jgi:hypothetical protein
MLNFLPGVRNNYFLTKQWNFLLHNDFIKMLLTFFSLFGSANLIVFAPIAS